MAKKIVAGNGGVEIPQDEIARCAYEMWEREGRPEGRDAQHWYQAEAQLRESKSRDAQATSGADAPKTSPPRRTSGVARSKRFAMVT